MEHDVIDHTAPSSEASESSVEITEELLVEEISIDGMCGVY
jgi:mycofactocin precursor